MIDQISMQHPDDTLLRLFVGARLNAEEEESIEKHLAQCLGCAERVSMLETYSDDLLLKEANACMDAFDDFSSETTLPTIPPDQVYQKVLTPLSPGDIVGGTLRIEKKLGRGGMGETWKAYDMTAERYVVLKFVLVELQHVKEVMEAVPLSFKKIDTLQHQHICPVYKLVNDPKYGFYIEMKYIDGVTLRDYRRKNPEMSFHEIISILYDVADGLDYAYQKSHVVHRDIKPGNIMISREDGPQIIDYGLAEKNDTISFLYSVASGLGYACHIGSHILHRDVKPSNCRKDGPRTIDYGLAETMAVYDKSAMEDSGTRPYMAPEQWEKKMQDGRTDQYALAVTAYELFAGHRPFQESDIDILRERVLNEKPLPIPGIPKHINSALAKALSKKRGDRFPDCKSFVKALKMPADELGMPASEWQATIDVVYQPDGSTDFTKNNVITGQYVIRSFGYCETAQGKNRTGYGLIFDPKEETNVRDLNLLVSQIGSQETPLIAHVTQNDTVGHYRLGRVNFNTVEKAIPSRIEIRESPCKLFDVFVVRTFHKGNYAKFLVRSIQKTYPPFPRHFVSLPREKLVPAKDLSELTGIEKQKISTPNSPRWQVRINASLQKDGSTRFIGDNVITVKDKLVDSYPAWDNEKVDNMMSFFDQTWKSESCEIFRVPFIEHVYIYINNDGTPLFIHTNEEGKVFNDDGKIFHNDLGEVDFDSVEEIDPTKIKIQLQLTPCVLNHVYVVPTCRNGPYCKFVVRSIINRD